MKEFSTSSESHSQWESWTPNQPAWFQNPKLAISSLLRALVPLCVKKKKGIRQNDLSKIEREKEIQSAILERFPSIYESENKGDLN